jgi:hypothetical protein
MARANQRLIEAVEQTIARLTSGADYQWGHMGMCNCGHLVQSLTTRSRREIHAAALLRAGDWGQQSIDYCPTSGLPIDSIISEMLEAGLTLDDINYLERLNDPRVLALLSLEERWMKRNNRDHLVRYLTTWNTLLKAQWAERQSKFLEGIMPDSDAELDDAEYDVNPTKNLEPA